MMMSDQSTGGSHDLDYEIGEMFGSKEVLDQRGHSLTIVVLTEEDGIPIPEGFQLKSVGQNYWFLPKVEDEDGYVSAKDRQFLCVAESKNQLDKWLSELVSGENQTVEDVSLLGDEINVEWDDQSGKLLFMP
ncbi:hypothetical protein [Halobacterium salinarum]|uniref:hypothetical protein n=1 Tax=Halobacterium salinarum TaxID=2242 RepID=UPI002556F2F4|nr:hypothetical protein [Halobacterium salinarum]MDL0146016.1 hypothetical protein [Halobacterium salinarum]